MVSPKARVSGAGAAEGQHQGQNQPSLLCQPINLLIFATAVGLSLKFLFLPIFTYLTTPAPAFFLCLEAGFEVLIVRDAGRGGELSQPCPQCSATQFAEPAAAVAGMLICPESLWCVISAPRQGSRLQLIGFRAFHSAGGPYCAEAAF